MSEQETVDRINAMLAEMPPLAAAALVQQWHKDAARMGAQALEPPPLMRAPEFPWGLHGLNATVARYECRQPGCSTVYLEQADELPGPLTLPANFTADDVSAAITAQADERSQLRLDRVQQAFTEHYRTEHPEALEEIHGTPSPAAR
ncbi:hypothetical protein [Streptomyces sp. OK228]|uniref:hypothetical protein n=1 Tax=Streptomyces sp. OK228 TaxID=1882786 RepID=UPI000BD16912|nr:hypothetical protein [Streptomyces sp. OK228]SOE31821.1 hypothetical protein SAMN05442782_8755 [Streptomyces sp. OK228]